MTVFMYQADVYCESCGLAICEELNRERASRGLAPLHHESEIHDTDEFPKSFPQPGESDTPDHCGSGEHCIEAEVIPFAKKVGKFLDSDLTEEGMRYVATARGPVANWWRRIYGIEYERGDRPRERKAS